MVTKVLFLEATILKQPRPSRLVPKGTCKVLALQLHLHQSDSLILQPY